jgi:hypothetical protein
MKPTKWVNLKMQVGMEGTGNMSGHQLFRRKTVKTFFIFCLTAGWSSLFIGYVATLFKLEKLCSVQ